MELRYVYSYHFLWVFLYARLSVGPSVTLKKIRGNGCLLVGAFFEHYCPVVRIVVTVEYPDPLFFGAKAQQLFSRKYSVKPIYCILVV